ncbi:DUF2695 domain-containing protein [Promethearchaeum syntrophicum]|uniref:DUF2695 domain-containing protein n=1 Tax=Promethearchaeum syntrophicum TaxID=2594042 RepID=A0AC61ZU13_9ARCH
MNENKPKHLELDNIAFKNLYSHLALKMSTIVCKNDFFNTVEYMKEYLPEYNIDKTLEFFKSQSAFCDCEILLNLLPKKNDIEKNIEEEGIKFEILFNENRIYGDERDFELFEGCHHETEIPCVIHKKSPFQYPELAFNHDNLIVLCSGCVKNAIKKFKEIKNKKTKNE